MTERPVLLISRKLPAAVEAAIAQKFVARFNPDDRVYSTDELIAKAEGADGLLICPSEKLSADVIGALPASVRIVASYSVGTDHIDLAAARGRGLIVTNTPDVLNNATAEIALMLLIGAARRASEADRLVRAGGWESWSPEFMVGAQVTGKKVGIVGMGRIGRIMAQRCRGFDMDIHYHNRTRLPEDQEQGAVFHADIDDLFAAVDFVTLHCPATPETTDLINAKSIARMRDGVVIVNTGRGALVDDDAIIAGLESGKVGAFGSDVFKNEPNLNPRYADISNTFLLPHIGSATTETRQAMGRRALENLTTYFAGTDPMDRVA